MGEEMKKEGETLCTAETGAVSSPRVTVKRRRTSTLEAEEVRKEAQILRFACSKVAQYCGLCHFPRKEELVQLIVDLLYQDLDHVLRADCAQLGLVLTTEEEEMDRIIAKLSKESQELLENVRSKALNSAADVQASHTKVREVLQEELKRSIVSQSELDRATEQFIRGVNTRFGIAHEHLAINQFEAANPHWKVCERNVLSYLWPFSIGDTETTVAGASALPTALECVAVQPTDVREVIEVFDRADTVFFLCGAVDGIAKHIEAEGDSPDRVVEVKHRVRGFKTPPPFYEVVQLVCYLRMLGLEEGFHIQCLREARNGKKNGESTELNISILTEKVALNEMHDAGWKTAILPRLQTLAEFIYSMRKKDADRHDFIASPVHVQCEQLARQLPFLSHLC